MRYMDSMDIAKVGATGGQDDDVQRSRPSPSAGEAWNNRDGRKHSLAELLRAQVQETGVRLEASVQDAICTMEKVAWMMGANVADSSTWQFSVVIDLQTLSA
jgi:hypothetical protein